MVDCPSECVRNNQQLQRYVKLAAVACGLVPLSENGLTPYHFDDFNENGSTGVAQSIVRDLEAKWIDRRDFEWCLPATELHDYKGAIDPSQRRMCIKHNSCYSLLGGGRCGFETWSRISESLFHAYRSYGGDKRMRAMLLILEGYGAHY